MYQTALQPASNCSPGLVGLETLFSLRHGYDALRLRPAEHPSYDEPLPPLRFAARLPSASLTHGCLCGLRLCGQLVASYRDLARKLGPLIDGYIVAYHALKRRACTPSCVAMRPILMFSRSAYDTLGFFAECPTSLNGLGHNYLSSTVRSCRRSISKLPVFCVP